MNVSCLQTDAKFLARKRPFVSASYEKEIDWMVIDGNFEGIYFPQSYLHRR
jgi:hypothetical protein